MITDSALLQEKLRSAGYSFTKPRRLFFETLARHELLSVAEIAKKLADSTDRASVYRAAYVLETAGIVHRVSMGWKYKLELAEPFRSHHHHIQCTHCGMVEDLPHDSRLEKVLRNISRELGYIESDHQVELKAICRNCASKLAF